MKEKVSCHHLTDGNENTEKLMEQIACQGFSYFKCDRSFFFMHQATFWFYSHVERQNSCFCRWYCMTKQHIELFFMKYIEETKKYCTNCKTWNRGAVLMTSPCLADEDASREARSHLINNYLYCLLNLLTVSRGKTKITNFYTS